MLYLHTSPSPARPTTTQDRDAKDSAAFRALGGGGSLRAKGRVLFFAGDDGGSPLRSEAASLLTPYRGVKVPRPTSQPHRSDTVIDSTGSLGLTCFALSLFKLSHGSLTRIRPEPESDVTSSFTSTNCQRVFTPFLLVCWILVSFLSQYAQGSARTTTAPSSLLPSAQSSAARAATPPRLHNKSIWSTTPPADDA